MTCLDAVDAVNGDPDYSGPAWTPGTKREPPDATSVEDWSSWRQRLDQEYDAIWELRDGQPAVVLGYGGWNPWHSDWQEVGIAEVCTANEEVLDEVMRQSAEAHGAMYVSLLDAFTGPGHDRDPGERGLLAEDGMHLSAEGVDLLVETIVASGFEPSRPPTV